MGKSSSKSLKNTGDAQIEIVNSLEEHTAYATENNVLLWVICVVVILLLLAELEARHKRSKQKQALQTAKSIVALTDVAAEK